MPVGPNDILDPRRSLRLPVRCAVDVRYRVSRFRAETDDLGPRGCQLVAPRLVPVGHEVGIAIDVRELGQTVEGTAKVVWSRGVEPLRLGLRFSPDFTDRHWFESLLRANLGPAAAARRPGTLPPRAHLYLGAPPRLVVDFTRDELAVLLRVRQGMSVADLVAALGRAPERLLGALFALLSRRQLVLDPRASPGAGAWREVLARAESMEAAEGLTPEHRLRPSAVERLLREGRDHLAAGRTALAAARFREAHEVAPDDDEVRAEVKRLGPFR